MTDPSPLRPGDKVNVRFLEQVYAVVAVRDFDVKVRTEHGLLTVPLWHCAPISAIDQLGDIDL